MIAAAQLSVFFVTVRLASQLVSSVNSLETLQPNDSAPPQRLRPFGTRQVIDLTAEPDFPFVSMKCEPRRPSGHFSLEGIKPTAIRSFFVPDELQEKHFLHYT